MSKSVLRRNEIIKAFFLEFTNQSEVSKRVYPKLWENQRKKKATSWSIPYVNKIFQELKKYFETKVRSKKIKQYGKEIDHKYSYFKLNLNFFFDSLEEDFKTGGQRESKDFERYLIKYNKKNQNYKTEKQTKVKDLIENRTQFTKIEKKIIEYIFSFQQIRELACRYDNLKEGILNILERMFLFKVTLEHETRGTDFIKGFLVNNKNFLEKTESPKEQYEIFWRKELKLNQDLSNKIKLISSFSKGDFLDLYEPIQKYTLMPTIIPHYLSNKKQEELLKKWGRVFYKNEDISKDWEF